MFNVFCEQKSHIMVSVLHETAPFGNLVYEVNINIENAWS